MAQYAAPGRDGTYIDDPGRENPAYDEKESLMMLNELERNNQDDDDNPFRASPDDDDENETRFRDDLSDDSSTDNRENGDRENGDRENGDRENGDRMESPQHSTTNVNKKEDESDDGSDNDSDDLFFDEDKEAIEKGNRFDDRRDDSEDAEDPTEFKDEFKDEGTVAEPPDDGRRQWTYSTANIKQRGVCMKWCCIILFFLLCLMIFSAISVLFEKLFFSDKGPEPEYPTRSENDTFPSNKELIDAVCSSSSIGMDRGARCREYCEPQHSLCCTAFPDWGTYNFTSVYEVLNRTNTSNSLAPSFAPSEYLSFAPTNTNYSNAPSFAPSKENRFSVDDTPNATFTPSSSPSLNDDFLGLDKCEFGEHLRGCSAYGKCSGLQGLLDPAPVTLPQLCSEEGLSQDDQSCPGACRKVQCCYDEEGYSCLNENFDVCMDYAPCQNLRKRENREILLVAPDDIDRVCLWGLPECHEYCEKARCCTDPNSRCLQENFVACLTYAACEDATDIKIAVPPMYSHVAQAPAELLYACGEKEPETEELAQLVPPGTCPEYCEQVACCYQDTPADNCFQHDPLGCLAWHHYCQTEAAAVTSWYIGKFILPTPP